MIIYSQSSQLHAEYCILHTMSHVRFPQSLKMYMEPTLNAAHDDAILTNKCSVQFYDMTKLAGCNQLSCCCHSCHYNMTFELKFPLDSTRYLRSKSLSTIIVSHLQFYVLNFTFGFFPSLLFPQMDLDDLDMIYYHLNVSQHIFLLHFFRLLSFVFHALNLVIATSVVYITLVVSCLFLFVR